MQPIANRVDMARPKGSSSMSNRTRASNRAETWIALIAAAGACVAAGAAFWQASISRDTEFRQLRSYLYVTHGSLELGGPAATVKVSIKHSGATPAYNVRIDTTALVAGYLLNDESLGDPITMGGADRRQVAILNGDDQFDFAATQSAPGALRILTNLDKTAGEHALYVHGVVRYQDIFGIEGHQPERRYEFCFVFRPNVDVAGSERGCEKYNKPG